MVCYHKKIDIGSTLSIAAQTAYKHPYGEKSSGGTPQGWQSFQLPGGSYQVKVTMCCSNGLWVLLDLPSATWIHYLSAVVHPLVGQVRCFTYNNKLRHRVYVDHVSLVSAPGTLKCTYTVNQEVLNRNFKMSEIQNIKIPEECGCPELKE